MKLKSNPQVPRGICATSCDPLFNDEVSYATYLLSLVELGHTTIDKKLCDMTNYFVGLMRDIKCAGASG